MRLGTIDGARKALAGDLPYIGEGCNRQAYRDGDIVYKVEYEDGIEYRSNLSEYNRYLKRASIALPKGYSIVPMRLISVDDQFVIAARYIDGQKMGECWCVGIEAHHYTECISDIASSALIMADLDPSYGNIIYDGTTYWVVDAE